MTNEVTIKAVYVFKNGNCAVFDSNDQQMPELQGLWTEKRDAICHRLMLEGDKIEVQFQ